MPHTATAFLSVTINSVEYRRTDTVTSNGLEVASVTVPAAKTGALTTRTDANTGTLTMAADHGITNGQKLSIFWSGGSRSNVTVGTVSVNEVPIDLGSGDDLPADETSITAMVATSVAFVITGDDIESLGVSCPNAASGWVVFKASGSIVKEYQILAGEKAHAWASGLGITNPLASGAVTTVEFSHDLTSEQEMTASVTF